MFLSCLPMPCFDLVPFMSCHFTVLTSPCSVKYLSCPCQSFSCPVLSLSCPLSSHIPVMSYLIYLDVSKGQGHKRLYTFSKPGSLSIDQRPCLQYNPVLSLPCPDMYLSFHIHFLSGPCPVIALLCMSRPCPVLPLSCHLLSCPFPVISLLCLYTVLPCPVVSLAYLVLVMSFHALVQSCPLSLSCFVPILSRRFITTALCSFLRGLEYFLTIFYWLQYDLLIFFVFSRTRAAGWWWCIVSYRSRIINRANWGETLPRNS